MSEPRQSASLGDAFSAYEADRRAADAAAADAPIEPLEPHDPGCPYCAQPLPVGRTLKYCPSCGQNLLLRRCPGCSAEIESGWKFCVTCGRKA